ncbi:MAG: YebC/PmpR family DNA-binding transcriptional regulator [Desulfotomaculum sp.]|nr:YebC/PmpR family DNA-binding transcriptional regulator [Desulfotomaculum sp.]
MAGHSKWANIKHKKAKVDAKRGKVFTKLSKDIILAAKLGGGDPAANARLKTAVEKAKAANIPNDNIKRAIMKGTGQLDGTNAAELMYEGYGPGGVAIMVDIITDNRNRTAGEIRHILAKNGGNLGESGCVAWIFERKGLLFIEKENIGILEDELVMLALECGAEDIKVEDDRYEIYTTPDNLETVLKQLTAQNIQSIEAEITMAPQNTVKLQGVEAEKMIKILEILAEHDDVNNVYANCDISD